MEDYHEQLKKRCAGGEISTSTDPITKVCAECGQAKLRHFYHAVEWNRKRNGICMGCEEKIRGVKQRFTRGNGWIPNDYARSTRGI
jgi:hypothetical protein